MWQWIASRSQLLNAASDFRPRYGARITALYTVQVIERETYVRYAGSSSIHVAMQKVDDRTAGQIEPATPIQPMIWSVKLRI
jgi:hypothetical protein